MILAITIALVYMGGTCATMITRMNEAIDHEWENILSGRKETSEWTLALINVLIIVCAMFWPVYWSGRLLYAIPEQLALNPGEPQ